MDELRVMTWNLQGSRRPDLDEVAGRILASRADVVGFQEVRRGQASKIAARLRWHHHWALKHLSHGPLIWFAEGMAVLSPHPLIKHRRVLLNPGTSAWTYRRRIAQQVVLEAPHGPMVVFNVHLASHQAPSERARQSATVATLVRDHGDADPTAVPLVIGDLNAADEPDTLAPLEAAGLRDAWAISDDCPVRSAFGFTNPSASPTQRLDYVLVPDSLSVDCVDVPNGGADWAGLSDHLPVVARLRLR